MAEVGYGDVGLYGLAVMGYVDASQFSELFSCEAFQVPVSFPAACRWSIVGIIQVFSPPLALSDPMYPLFPSYLPNLVAFRQNFALNMASHGFKVGSSPSVSVSAHVLGFFCWPVAYISSFFPPPQVVVCNRSPAKVDTTVKRATDEGITTLTGVKSPKDFVAALSKPRKVILLVMAGKPVDDTIAQLAEHMEEGDLIVDGGNEWFPNSLRRSKELEPKKVREGLSWGY